MLNVTISTYALRKIEEHTKKPYEQIGFLIGDLTYDGLRIRNVVSGQGEANDSCSKISTMSLARIADDIVNGRIDGKIVGWYHSHIGAGVFMSDIDMQTHLRLQQFSTQVVALVIDTIAKEFGIFSYEPFQGLVQIPEDMIRIV